MTAQVTPIAWSFIVEGSPVPKARPRFVRKGPRAGHIYTPDTTTAFEAKVRVAAKLCGVPRLLRGVRLRIVAYVPDVRSKDWDNIGKAVCDALNPIRKKRKTIELGVAWVDDSQVTHATVIKRLDRERPRTEVTISPDPDGAAFGPNRKARAPASVSNTQVATSDPVVPEPAAPASIDRARGGVVNEQRRLWPAIVREERSEG